MFSNRIVATSLIALLPAVLVACGGGGGSDAPGTTAPAATNKTTVGQITGFGSIYVNGIEFDTAGASYEVDDALASNDDALAVGMVVKVEGSVNADGLTGSAFSVSYDDDVEGVVEQLMTDSNDVNIKSFLVMGVKVIADASSTNFESSDPNFSFETIAEGDVVEVSGDYGPDSSLFATYVEEQSADDDEYEAKGTVSNWNSTDSFDLVLRNGSFIMVTLAAGAEIPSAGIEEGQFVEVEGTIDDPAADPKALTAFKVELEDNDRLDDDDDEVEVKGVLNYDAASGTWSVKDIELAFGGGTEYKPVSLEDMIADQSAAGMTVEVDGEKVGEVLQVDEIELEEDELEFKADVEGKADNGTLTLSFGGASGTVSVIVTSETMFLDDDSVVSFNYDSINVGDKVEIEARWGEDGAIYASNLHLEDDSGYEIEGPADAVDDVSLTVLGVTFGVDAGTFFEDGTPVVGDYVEVEDDNGDGTADSVEIED
jgi:hypothetical protein